MSYGPRFYDGQIGQSKDALSVCDNILPALLLVDPTIYSSKRWRLGLLSVRSLSVDRFARLVPRVAQSFAQIVRAR